MNIMGLLQTFLLRDPDEEAFETASSFFSKDFIPDPDPAGDRTAQGASRI